jgi:hypothetical protein
LNPEKYFFHFFKAYFNFKYKIMETEKQKIEAEEPYQNVYEQYYQYDSDWHNWLCYIKGVIKEDGGDSDYIKSQISKLDAYMLNSVLGEKWYECECPDLRKNEPLSKRFILWWNKMYEGKLQRLDDTTSKVDECNLFFLNYSKWRYLKSLVGNSKPQQGYISLLQTDEAKELLKSAKKNNFLDENLQPKNFICNGISEKWVMADKALFAQLTAIHLKWGGNIVYPPFMALWGITGKNAMATASNKASSKGVKHEKQIRDFFRKLS